MRGTYLHHYEIDIIGVTAVKCKCVSGSWCGRLKLEEESNEIK